MTPNPLHDGLRIEPTPGATTLVIFGASGDLTRRKLLPAIYRLSRGQRLPARFSVIGVGRTELTDEQFRAQFAESLREFAGVKDGGDEVAASIAQRLRYLAGELADPALYQRLADQLKEDGAEGVLYYFAIPPAAYTAVVEGLGAAGLAGPSSANGWRRVVVEKPFGTDLSTARELTRAIHKHFDESQVFRIDHYLGKETVQNLLVFRFANGLFEPIWNQPVHRPRPDHCRGDRRRGAARGLLREAGALRDMVQNHLLQLLMLVGDGTADRVHGRQRTRSKDGCAALGAADRRRGARPVQPRLGEWRRSPGIP